jgi:hypothetical protein
MERFTETIEIHGVFRMRVYQNGVLVEMYEDQNLIVNMGCDQLAHLIAGDFIGRHITHIAFGTNGDIAVPADTAITNAFQEPVESVEFPQMGQVRFNWTLGADQANGKAIMEFGLITEDGKLFARRTRTNPLNKESDFSLEGDWTIEF